jgi:hypothetical protein
MKKTFELEVKFHFGGSKIVPLQDNIIILVEAKLFWYQVTVLNWYYEYLTNKDLNKGLH